MSKTVHDYLTFGNTISFEVYPASILGTRFDNVKVMGTFDKDTARMWIDPDAMHVNVFPTLPSGVPDDPNQYQFVKLKHTNGSITILGVPWIREDTIQISQKGTLTVTVNDVGPADRDRIIRALSANGYKTSAVSLK